jgi:hypothetical protein
MDSAVVDIHPIPRAVWDRRKAAEFGLARSSMCRPCEAVSLRPYNVGPFTGRGRADDRSNHSKRSAAAVQCSGGLCNSFERRDHSKRSAQVPRQRVSVRSIVLGDGIERRMGLHAADGKHELPHREVPTVMVNSAAVHGSTGKLPEILSATKAARLRVNVGRWMRGLGRSLLHNGPTFNGRPGTDRHSNHEGRSAGPVQRSVGLSRGRAGLALRTIPA